MMDISIWPVRDVVTHTMPALGSHSGASKIDATKLADTLDMLHECARTCTADADADLREQHVADLVKCIRLCLDCADVCGATATVITRQTEFDPNAIAPLLEACATMCKSSVTNVSNMLRCTSIAGCAPSPAGNVNGPAGSLWPHYTE